MAALAIPKPAKRIVYHKNDAKKVALFQKKEVHLQSLSALLQLTMQRQRR